MLGVCYDRALLLQRIDVLQTLDLVGVPASTLENAMAAIGETRFDLMVICSRVPLADRITITKEFRRRQHGKVIWPRLPDEPECSLVDAYCEPGQPYQIMETIRQVLEPPVQ